MSDKCTHATGTVVWSTDGLSITRCDWECREFLVEFKISETTTVSYTAAELASLREQVRAAEVIEAMKSDPLRIEHRMNNRKLIWVTDKEQWEVYSFDRIPEWHYKGDSITDALAALKGGGK